MLSICRVHTPREMLSLVPMLHSTWDGQVHCGLVVQQLFLEHQLMWMEDACTLVPHTTISVAVTEVQTVFGVEGCLTMHLPHEMK